MEHSGNAQGQCQDSESSKFIACHAYVYKFEIYYDFYNQDTKPLKMFCELVVFTFIHYTSLSN